MSTPADRFRAFCLHELGEEYEWGTEGAGGPEGEDTYDCSGLFHAAMKYAGVSIPRTTAHGYYKLGRSIPAPANVGDFAVMLTDGHAHHIVLYVGKGEVIEARGEAWGVVKTTVPAVNARGAVWCRLPLVQMGQLTESEEEVDMTDEERKLLKQCRLSTLANSFDLAIVKALLQNDAAKALALEEERTTDIAAERKRLGI